MSNADLVGTGVEIKRWSLIKWEGEAPPPGPIDRTPFELIVGRDGEETRILHPDDPGYDDEFAIECQRFGWERVSNAAN